MRKITFEENEYLVLAILDGGSRQLTQENIEQVFPHLGNDEPMVELVTNTLEKLKRLSDIEYRRLDLEPYKEEPEEEE
ncbi:MAG: hypothetical protein EOM40_07625 [Clostridia bacterium]|nr:hypothetical protein [Clostridia bacterium]